MFSSDPLETSQKKLSAREETLAAEDLAEEVD